MTLGKRIIHTGHSYAALPLRLALGLVFIAHGAQKLFGWWGGNGLEGTAGFFENSLGLAPGIFWAFLAGAGEFVGGIMILLGALTRIGATLTGVTMIVALFLVHRNAFFLPEGMEFVLTLLAASLALIVIGGGAFSVDSTIETRQEAKTKPAE